MSEKDIICRSLALLKSHEQDPDRSLSPDEAQEVFDLLREMTISYQIMKNAMKLMGDASKRLQKVCDKMEAVHEKSQAEKKN